MQTKSGLETGGSKNWNCLHCLDLQDITSIRKWKSQIRFWKLIIILDFCRSTCKATRSKRFFYKKAKENKQYQTKTNKQPPQIIENPQKYNGR